jgi:hypothetical protein
MRHGSYSIDYVRIFTLYDRTSLQPYTFTLDSTTAAQLTEFFDTIETEEELNDIIADVSLIQMSPENNQIQSVLTQAFKAARERMRGEGAV